MSVCRSQDKSLDLPTCPNTHAYRLLIFKELLRCLLTAWFAVAISEERNYGTVLTVIASPFIKKLEMVLRRCSHLASASSGWLV